jgi:hypothetical protein
MATVTRELIGGGSKVVQKFTIDWTSDGSGNATETVNLFGFLLKAVTDPDGTAAPTDNYDITLVQNGVDMVGGILADRDTANNEIVYGLVKNGTDIAPLPPFLAGEHTFTVANAGASKSGRVILYICETL